MAAKAGGTATKPSAAMGGSVEDFLTALDHPAKQEILALRQLILAADERIGEEIKWKVPSFRTSEHFATLLEWLAEDRAMVAFRDLHEVARKQQAFTDLIREWIKHV